MTYAKFHPRNTAIMPCQTKKISNKNLFVNAFYLLRMRASFSIYPYRKCTQNRRKEQNESYFFNNGGCVGLLRIEKENDLISILTITFFEKRREPCRFSWYVLILVLSFDHYLRIVKLLKIYFFINYFVNDVSNFLIF